MTNAAKEVAKKFRDSFKDDNRLPESESRASATAAFVAAISAIPSVQRLLDERAALKFIKADPVAALESPLVRKMIGRWYELARRGATKDERRSARDNLETFADALRPKKRGPGAITLSSRELLRLFELCCDHYSGKAVSLPPEIAKEATEISKERTPAAAAKKLIAKVNGVQVDVVDLRVRQAKHRYDRFMAALKKDIFAESEFDELFSPGSFRVAVAPAGFKTEAPNENARDDELVGETQTRPRRRGPAFEMKRKR